MTVYRARKLAFFYYFLGAVLLFVALLLRPMVVLRWLLYLAAAMLAVLGYRTAYRYSRCPKCGHVVSVGLGKVIQCSICRNPIDKTTIYRL